MFLVISFSTEMYTHFRRVIFNEMILKVAHIIIIKYLTDGHCPTTCSYETRKRLLHSLNGREPYTIYRIPIIIIKIVLAERDAV